MCGTLGEGNEEESCASVVLRCLCECAYVSSWFVCVREKGKKYYVSQDLVCIVGTAHVRGNLANLLSGFRENPTE